MTITASQTIYGPAQTSSLDAPLKKKTRTTSATRDFTKPLTRYYYSQIREPYPLHEKYDLQEVHGCKFSRFDAHIIKVNRIDPPDETIKADLPVYFLYHADHQRWLIIKCPTSKNYEETWYNAIEKNEMTPNPYSNIVSWTEFLEKACDDAEGEKSLSKLEPTNI